MTKGERERFQVEGSEKGMERGEKRRLADEKEKEVIVGCSPDCSSPTPTSVDGESREEVMSEVHLGCPPRFSGPYISRFTFAYPPSSAPDEGEKTSNGIDKGSSTYQRLCMDDDGDLVLSRLNKASTTGRVTIQHNITSSIPTVGLQVWRAALVLADFVLHKSLTSSDFNDIVAVELGAGTGLVGILLARVAKAVFLTDYDDKVLGNCVINADLNSRIFKYHRASVCIRELNWKKSWPPTVISDKNHTELHKRYRDELLIKLLGNLLSRARYWWTPSEIEAAQGAPLILAADVIYSDDLTDAFFNTLGKLMSRGCEKVLYLALEKRYNFSLDDLDVVANGYLRFRSYLWDEEGGKPARERLPCFVGKLVDLTEIPQYVRKYERGNDLEIWQIKYSPLETSM